MLEGTFRCSGGVFLLHCHVVPTTDPDVGQMIQACTVYMAAVARRRDPARCPLGRRLTRDGALKTADIESLARALASALSPA